MQTLIWTDHAIQRVAERIGFSPNIPIPIDSLLKTGSIIPNGYKFRQRIGPVIYVCKRDGDKVIILTVVSPGMENRHENHYSRKSKRIYARNRRYCDEASD